MTSLVGMRMPAALAAAALLVTGCAAQAERPFTPAGDAASSPGAVSSPAGTSPAGASPGAARPLSTGSVESVEAAPGLTVSIEWPAGLDAGQRGVAKAFTDAYVGTWKAVAGGEDTAYLGSVEEQAARDAYTWVRGFRERRESATGTAKVYALRVPAVVGRGAEVDACVDESGIQVTDAGSGRPVTSQPSWTRPPAAVYLQAAGVRRGDDGAWRVRTYMHAAYPHQRAKECRR
ncbi:hypothetical protein Skr01_13850 [Sphaerisporangium krabiense]|nr:hypothetical protein Skr01_13850 [Sphaerisporangium krabiense]